MISLLCAWVACSGQKPVADELTFKVGSRWVFTETYRAKRDGFPETETIFKIENKVVEVRKDGYRMDFSRAYVPAAATDPLGQGGQSTGTIYLDRNGVQDLQHSPIRPARMSIIGPDSYRSWRPVEILIPPEAIERAYRETRITAPGDPMHGIPAAEWTLKMGPLRRNLSPYEFSVTYRELGIDKPITGTGLFTIWGKGGGPPERFLMALEGVRNAPSGKIAVEIRLIEPKSPYSRG